MHGFRMIAIIITQVLFLDTIECEWGMRMRLWIGEKIQRKAYLLNRLANTIYIHSWILNIWYLPSSDMLLLVLVLVNEREHREHEEHLSEWSSKKAENC